MFATVKGLVRNSGWENPFQGDWDESPDGESIQLWTEDGDDSSNAILVDFTAIRTDAER